MLHGSRISLLRDQKGWTQEELANRLGITRAALSHYEKNRRKPDFETLRKLADIFEVSIDYLIGRDRENVTQFTDQLELANTDLLERFELTVDGRKLTEEEARRFINFIRAERMSDL